MRLIKELIAAILVLSSIVISRAHPEEASATPTACVSSSEVMKQIGILPLSDLTGKALADFNARYSKKYNDDVPDVDEVLFFAEDNNPNVLVVTFKAGCMSGIGPAGKAEVLVLLQGEKS